VEPRRLLTSAFIRAIASPGRREAFRRAAEARRRLSGAPHRVELFHQVDDPYSHLLVQALPALLDRCDVELVPHLAGPPSARHAGAPDLLAAWARRDAADVAPHFGLRFADPGAAPSAGPVRAAERALAGLSGAGAGDPQRFLERARAVGDALWAKDEDALDALAGDVEAVTADVAAQRVEAGTRRRARLGHYLGATLHHAGEWYWGVDRLDHLARRLDALGAVRPGAGPAFARPGAGSAADVDARGVTLEFFPSLRSPYTYIAMPRVLDLAHRTGARLVLRPVLPMVMRGVPAPPAKGIYIMFDTRREAERLGMAFGRVTDPIGRPVERGLSLFPWARDRGRGAELLWQFLRAAFAEGVDTGSDRGLRRVVERAGLSWAEARGVVDGDAWRDEIESNRVALYQEGLWGVPSFRVRGGEASADYSTWGQDRLFRVEQEIVRRAGPAA